jgi:hypothetical protein
MHHGDPTTLTDMHLAALRRLKHAYYRKTAPGTEKIPLMPTFCSKDVEISDLILTRSRSFVGRNSAAYCAG